mmetsp:Transcript_3879/g.8322  ORF Transcript_3879/g.8322 Transcript_3879/m.8322 type:complete len:326 (+) Transcript_3879:394-1371(+)
MDQRYFAVQLSFDHSIQQASKAAAAAAAAGSSPLQSPQGPAIQHQASGSRPSTSHSKPHPPSPSRSSAASTQRSHSARSSWSSTHPWEAASQPSRPSSRQQQQRATGSFNAAASEEQDAKPPARNVWRPASAAAARSQLRAFMEDPFSPLPSPNAFSPHQNQNSMAGAWSVRAGSARSGASSSASLYGSGAARQGALRSWGAAGALSSSMQSPLPERGGEGLYSFRPSTAPASLTRPAAAAGHLGSGRPGRPSGRASMSAVPMGGPQPGPGTDEGLDATASTVSRLLHSKQGQQGLEARRNSSGSAGGARGAHMGMHGSRGGAAC